MIEIIAGTNRPSSNARRIANLLQVEYKKVGVRSAILDLAGLPREIFDPMSYAKKPATFFPYQQRVLDAHGLHIVTPEYNGSFPGVLKYFVDMLKFPESFERKPVAFLGEAAGIWGGFRSVEQLQLIFGYRNAILLPERVWIPKVNEKLNPDGTWADPELAQRVSQQCAFFKDFITKLRGSSPTATRV